MCWKNKHRAGMGQRIGPKGEMKSLRRHTPSRRRLRKSDLFDLHQLSRSGGLVLSCHRQLSSPLSVARC